MGVVFARRTPGPVDESRADESDHQEIGPALWVGPADDIAERSADAAADCVMQRFAARDGDAVGTSRIHRSPRRRQRPAETLPPAAHRVSRATTPSPAPLGREGGRVDPDIALRIRRTAGTGRPIDRSTRSAMEGAFGADFSRVRLHTDSESAQLNRTLGATAFTFGSDIHLGADAPRLGTSSGTRLLAHELAHVVQEGPSPARTSTTGAARTAPGTPIRRYDPLNRPASDASPEVAKYVKDYQRASSNKGIFQTGKNSIVARDDILATSEQALKAQGSFVQLVGSPFTPGYSRVKVQFRGATARQRGDPDVDRLATAALQTGPERVKELVAGIEAQMSANRAEQNPSKVAGAKSANEAMGAELVQLAHPAAEDLFVTVRDCHRTARTIMGSLGITNKEEHVVFNDTDGTIRKVLGTPDDNEGKNFGGGSTAAQLGAVRFLKLALTAKFADLLPIERNDLANSVRRVADRWDYQDAMAVYEAIQADPQARKKFNETYGVNDQAHAAVGQALTQVNDIKERAMSLQGKFISPRTGKTEDLWNFHWAGVVLRDGADYVTLQAVADQQASTLTVHWWFKMYGPGDQSFHTEESEDSHVGTRPLTVAVEAKPRERKPVVNPFETK